MSVTFVLLPIAIAAIGGSLGAGVGLAAVGSQAYRGKQVSLVVPTRFRDADLLKRTLSAQGYRSIALGDNIALAVGSHQLVFRPAEDGTFALTCLGEIDRRQAMEFVDTLHVQYIELLRRQVYERLLDRAHQRGFVLESQTEEGNNVLALTFAVG
jgi:hypothetical protein